MAGSRCQSRLRDNGQIAISVRHFRRSAAMKILKIGTSLTGEKSQTKRSPMNRSIVILALLSTLVLGVTIARAPALDAQSRVPSDTLSPELAYLKQINQWRPPSDPELLFILMEQFANAGRHVEGITYFEELLTRFGPDLTDNQKAQYLVCRILLEKKK